MTIKTLRKDNKSTTKPYRPCVGIALFNAQGKVFVGSRIDASGAWQMPQGGIEKGESPSDAALREMMEEIGTRKAEILEVAKTTLKYDFPQDLQDRVCGGLYRGQEQTWIAARFIGNDSDIDIDHHEHKEFDKWRWVNLADTPNMIVPFKRDVYNAVSKMFEQHSRP